MIDFFAFKKDCLTVTSGVESCTHYDEIHELWKLNLSNKHMKRIFWKVHFKVAIYEDLASRAQRWRISFYIRAKNLQLIFFAMQNIILTK